MNWHSLAAARILLTFSAAFSDLKLWNDVFMPDKPAEHGSGIDAPTTFAARAMLKTRA